MHCGITSIQFNDFSGTVLQTTAAPVTGVTCKLLIID